MTTKQQHNPLNIDFFFLDSGAEDLHDIVVTLSDNNQNKFVEVTLDQSEGWMLVNQLKGIAYAIQREMVERQGCYPR